MISSNMLTIVFSIMMVKHDIFIFRLDMLTKPILTCTMPQNILESFADRKINEIVNHFHIMPHAQPELFAFPVAA
jgi:hypothetical protein